MGRSRSRSPSRRDRRRSRDRDRRRDDRHRRSKSRSRSPRRRDKSRSPRRRDRDDQPRSSKVNKLQEPPAVTTEAPAEKSASGMDVVGEDSGDAEADMMKAMGFSGFDSTKGKKIAGNDIYVANIQKKRRYRQYMNRKGGFNRPLDFIA